MQIEVKLTGATKVIKEGEGEKKAGGENWGREDALTQHITHALQKPLTIKSLCLLRNVKKIACN